ncbi:sensor histidine kinase [Thauera mechernichensis]
MTLRNWRLRSFVVAIMAATTVMVVVLVVAALLAISIPALEDETQREVQLQANDHANRTQIVLGALESRLEVVGESHALVHAEVFAGVLDMIIARTPMLRALYLVDANGRVTAAGLDSSMSRLRSEILGSDLSSTPLLRATQATRSTTWSDTYLSALSGVLTVGVATPAGDSHVLIGEVPLDAVLSTLEETGSTRLAALWVIDSRGEVITESRHGPGARRMNLNGLPLLQASLAGTPLPPYIDFEGQRYHAGLALSEALNWRFVTIAPTGLDNPRVSRMVIAIGAAFAIALLLGVLLSRSLAQLLLAPLNSIIAQARDTAHGRQGHWPRGPVVELNALSGDLEAMAAHLQSLNLDLEQRVAQRTEALAESNRSLQATLAELERTQHELVRAEKMAALGGLVAGVAHELNTPIGNGLMAVSTLQGQAGDFRRCMQAGLRRSDLDAFLLNVDQAADIATRNLSRAADLVTSFKQVAVDQSSAQRRRFMLDEVVDEIIITLRPSIRRLPFSIETDIQPGLELDSYPGPLGQVLANLINNALIHAFEDREQGTIVIAARRAEDGRIRLTVSDDGQGMDASVLEQVFEPFFTTRKGRGGTGLGLHIAFNAVANVLGGSLTASSAKGRGSCFELHIPAIAPSMSETGATA